MFILISITMMWLMIFGVGCFYYGMLPKEKRNHIITVTTLSLFTATLSWIFIGYSLAFNTNTIFFTHNASMDNLLNLLFHLCFCLYAIVMVIGSVVDRLSIKITVIVSFIWVIAVYAPLVRLFWSTNGLLSQLGALDFSGGMVVHLSAGLSSYLLAYFFPKKDITNNNTIQNEWLYIGTIFITLGWFFFNAGPVGELNLQSVEIIIKTLFALIIGCFTWLILAYTKYKTISTDTLLNGTIVGLVTSTSSVGFVNTWQLAIIVLFSSSLTYLAIQYLLPRFNIDDVVDSFGMNGIGGALGSIGTVIFIPSALIGQLTGLFITTLISSITTTILCLILKNKNRV